MRHSPNHSERSLGALFFSLSSPGSLFPCYGLQMFASQPAACIHIKTDFNDCNYH